MDVFPEFKEFVRSTLRNNPKFFGLSFRGRYCMLLIHSLFINLVNRQLFHLAIITFPSSCLHLH